MRLHGGREHARRWCALRRAAPLEAALLLAVACAADEEGLAPVAEVPRVAESSVAQNPNSVLSAVATARVEFAESVAARYGVAGSPLGDLTPAVRPTEDEALVPILGLLPDTDYRMQLVAYGSALAVGDTLDLATGALPADLPRYAAGGSDPSPGYVVFGANPYGLVIDNSGRVVWYHRFSDPLGLNFQVQPTGRYFARPTTPDATDRDPWVEIDVLGTVTRTLGCARGLQPRFHDLIAEPDGSYWIMCDETRMMDLSDVGGVAGAQVTGTVVQHLSAGGTLLFEWNPFDHFAITDLDEPSRTGANVNWTHGNSLDLDSDGNLVISFRSLSEITKIDVRTGTIVWRMGGLRNQFAFLDTPEPAFARQHGVRMTAPGQFLLLDNAGDPAASRAERYAYDAAVRAARLVGSYAASGGVVAELGGSTQDLPGGRTLVSYGNGRRVEEYDASGNVVWRIDGDPGYVFRAQRIQSLYRPGAGLPR